MKMQIRRSMVSAGAIGLLAPMLAGCFHEVALNPQSRGLGIESLPLSAKIEVAESLSGGKVPIRFDMQTAAVAYFKNRGTFREVVTDGSDVVLKVASRFALSSEVKFRYDFEMQAALQGGGRRLGSYHVRCSATGGAMRLSSEADVAPMNKALAQCLDDLAEQIEANGPALLAQLRGGVPAAGSAAAEAPQGSSRGSDVDRPLYRRDENPDDYALVVGIEKYARLPEAKFAESDADAMKRHLRALGYPERNIILLKGGQATRGTIQGYVEEWLPKNTRSGSRVFVYFSGHGSPDTKSGDAYLVPWDGDAMLLKSTAYPLKSLYAALGKLKAKRVVVALDSCFSGAGGRSVLAEGARPLVTRVDAVAAPAGVTVLSAASGDEITATIVEQGHGAFTYYLLKAFNDGKLTAQTAYNELKPRVQDEAHRQNREQTPLLIGDDAAF